jgi:hypothetical protein
VFSGTWRCHLDTWCIDTIQVGSVTYTKEQAGEILNLQQDPHNIDALLRLVKNVIETKLNLFCNHSPADCIEGTIANTEFIVGNHISPPFGPLGQLPPGTGNDLFLIMLAYNHGELCAPSCEDEDLTCPDP